MRIAPGEICAICNNTGPGLGLYYLMPETRRIPGMRRIIVCDVCRKVLITANIESWLDYCYFAGIPPRWQG